MIFIPGEFSFWTLVGTFIGGWTIGTIAALVAGGLAAAGGTAHLVKSLVEGNMPWEDPEGFLLGQLKAGVGGIGEIVRDIQGEDTLQEQLKNLERSSNQGTGVVAPGSTGQGLAQISAEMKGQQAERVPGVGFGGGAPAPSGGGGAARFDAMDAGEDTPSRGDILKGAAKDIGIGGATMAASFAAPYIGAALGPATQAAGTAAQTAAPVATEIAAAAPSAGYGALAVPDFANVASGLSSTAAPATSGISGAIQGAMSSARDFIQASPIGQAARALPTYIGDTATGVLQHGVTGGIKGALSSLVNDEDPGRGALMGLAGGLVSSGLGAGTSMLSQLGHNAFPGELGYQIAPGQYSPMGPFEQQQFSTPSFTGNLIGSATRPLPGIAGTLASGMVGQATAPTPPMPPEPPYASGRRPYWMDI